MKKTILVSACVAAVSVFTTFGASAQTTGPAGQDSTKMGTDTGMKKDSMDTKGMAKDGMNKDTMSKDGMSKDNMAKDNMSKDGMKKDGMSK